MDKSLTRMITLLARKSQICIGNVLNKYNLSAAEQSFFMALQHNEGITQEKLTAIVCVDKAATTRAVKSLEEKGYLIRKQDEKDKRQNQIYPTEQAKQIGNDVLEELLRLNDMVTKDISSEEIDIIYNALLKMNKNFNDILESKKNRME